VAQKVLIWLFFKVFQIDILDGLERRFGSGEELVGKIGGTIDGGFVRLSRSGLDCV
jgi:hypothetical protein